MVKSFWRGHPIVVRGKRWVYQDTGELVESNPERRCGACKRPSRLDGHDACLGTLPSVLNACCGHGDSDNAYVQFNDKSVLRGQEAITLQRQLVGGVNDLARDAKLRRRAGKFLMPSVYIGYLAFSVLIAIVWIELGTRYAMSVAFLAMIYADGAKALREVRLMEQGKLHDPFLDAELKLCDEQEGQ